MARMIPPKCPPETVSTAERQLFSAFRDGLGRDFTVIHSEPWVDTSSRRLREGECDFVVLHPARGLLAIEAKAGGISYEGPGKTWRRSDGKKIKDPFLQAQSSVHVLNRRLSEKVPEWKKANPPFGHAVAFPDADKVTGALPPHVVPDLLIFRSDLNKLDARIATIMERFGQGGGELDERTFDAVVNALLPVFQIVVSVSAALAEQEEALFRLTEQQIGVMDVLGHNRRLLVEGCAGSGKTVLAMEQAVRMASEGARVLLVCYNIPLADSMRKKLADKCSGVDVFNFHGLCSHVVNACGGDFPQDGDDEFWDMTSAQMLVDAIPSFEKRYDAIIVDEGQDFCELWWIALEELLADKDKGFFYIFRDSRQNIYERSDAVPFKEPSARLKVNCRNTAPIAELVHEYGGVTEAACKETAGIPPVIREVANDHDEREAVRKTLHELVVVQGLRTEQIVILGTRRFENTAFADGKKLGRFDIVDSIEPAGRDAVRYATLYRFKGLEADCVILVGFGAGVVDPEIEHERQQLYVAASRAKLLLYVFHRAKQATPQKT